MSGEVTRMNIIQHEFIGLQMAIIDTPDQSLANITGRVIDETMNTFKLECIKEGRQRIIIVPKHKNKFKFSIPTNDTNSSRKTGMINTIDISVNGSILTKRPEDRIKKLAKLANKMKKQNKNRDNRKSPNFYLGS